MKKYEQICLSFILSKALFFGIAISYIIGNAKNDSWLAIILGYLIGYYILNKFLTKKIYNIYQNNISKIIMMPFLIFVFSIIILTFTLQTSNFYLANTPPLIIAIVLILTINYGFKHGFDTLVRYTDILIIISLIFLFVGFIGDFCNFDINNFLPLQSFINYDFFKSVIATTLISITPEILLLSYKYDLDKKSILTGYLLGGGIIFLECIATIGVLGITLSSLYRYPVYIAFKKIKFNIFLERIENVLAAIWLIDLTIVGMLLMLCFDKVIKNKRITLFVCLIIGFITVKYGTNLYQNTIWLYKYMYYVLLTFLLIIYLITKKNL